MNDTFVNLDVIDDGDQIHVIDVGRQLDAKVDPGLEFSGIEVAGVGPAIATGDPLQFSTDPGALTRGSAIRFFYLLRYERATTKNRRSRFALRRVHARPLAYDRDVSIPLPDRMGEGPEQSDRSPPFGGTPAGGSDRRPAA